MQNTDAELERVTLGKVTWRLIPFMFLLYIFAMLDRYNVTIAVLTMKKDLGLNDEMYGLGAGIFFIGYFFFEIPSNVLMARFGARKWIARIMFTWGLIATAMMFMKTPMHFYVLRVLLGVAEAGFFPGMMLYLTYWFPNAHRGKAAARFIVAGAVAGIIGGPLGAFLLQLNGVGGLHGWQWLFLMEGIPSFLLGFVVLVYMTDKPEHAHWLRDEERVWLIRTLAAEQTHRQRFHHMSLLQALRYPRVLHLCAFFFLNIFSGAGMGVFTNLILRQRTGWSDQKLLLIGTIPGILGAIAMMVAASYSDKSRERRLYAVGGLLLAAVGVALAATTRSPLMLMIALCIVQIGTQIFNGPFWAMTTGFLSGAAAAGGIAFINSVGNSGSFFGPVLMGYLKTHTAGYETGLYLLTGTFVLAAIVGFLLPPDPALAPGAELLPSEPATASTIEPTTEPTKSSEATFKEEAP